MMNPEKLFYEQLEVTKQMVEELKNINSKLSEIKSKIDQSKDSSPFSVEDFLSGIFGIDTTNGSLLATELEDDLEDELDSLFIDGYDDDDDNVNNLDLLELLAIEDVIDLLDSKQLPFTFYGAKKYGYEPYSDSDVTFVTDYFNNKVVAKLWFNGELAKEGVAKCDPSDVFIEETGKAIALRRLFDLNIPESLLQH
jgi:hypothetical protein